MRLLRLQGRKTCDFVLRKGQQWRGNQLSVRFVFGHPRHPSARMSSPALYVGTLASAKLDKSAVRRNRMRRRCREALRTALLEWKGELPSAQLLLSPRSSSLEAPFSDIAADIDRFLRFLAACPTPRPTARASSTSS